MNRQLASFDIFVIVSELRDLIGSFIDKIYQLSKDDVLIKIRNVQQNKKEYLFIRNGEFICRTEKNIVTPLTPTTFAMTLRKYIANSKISSISQHEFDRIIRIEFEKGPRSYTLIIELFSQGNMMLLNQEENILIPLKRERWAHRKISIGTEYTSPPAQINPFSIDKNNFQQILQTSDADLVRTMAVQLNLGGVYAEELCYRAGIDKNTQISSLSDQQINTIYESFASFMSLFQDHQFQPVRVLREEEVVDVLPFEFISFQDLRFEEISQMVQSLEEFIVAPEKEETKEETDQEKKLNTLKRRLAQQTRAIKETEEKIQLKQQEGELIYLHFKECDELLNKIQEGLNQKNKRSLIEEIQSYPVVKTFNPQENTLIVSLTDINQQSMTIPIDFRKSVSENAEYAYKLSKKMHQKQRGAQKALEETKRHIKKIEAMEKEEISSHIQFRSPPKKTFWFEKYRWSLSRNGNLILGGKDAKTNDQLIKKHLEKGDRYAHADIHGAPSCIIKNKGIANEFVEITEEAIEEACIFAACYSRAWKQFTEAQAYWVLPEQVSKTPESGEYVPKGAFIIRGKRNYFSCTLRFALGLVKIDETPKIIAGSPSALKQWSSHYIIITPGNEKISETVKHIASELEVSSDEIQKVFPPGGTMIESIVKGEHKNKEEQGQ